MFKELKVLKFLLFFGVFFLLFFGKNVNNRLRDVLFFTSEYSSSNGEDIKLSFLAKKEKVSNVDVRILDLNGDIKLDTTLIGLKNPDNSLVSKITNGYTSEKTNFSLKLDPGFYSIKGGDYNDHPLVVINENESSQITVVVPLMNILMYQYIKGDKAIYGKNAVISTLQNIIMDDNLNDARVHFKQWEEKYTVNYITDYDLERLDVLSRSQLLIFAGNVRFWTQKMKNQLDGYIEKGGNILLISSYFQDNYAEFNPEKHQVRIRKTDQKEGNSAWEKKTNHLSSIISSTIGGIPSSVNYSNEYDIFENNISIQSDLDMGADDTATVLKLESGASFPIQVKWLLSRTATIKGEKNKSGVVEINLPNHQKIVSLGSCDWLRSYNQNSESNSINKIIEIIDYMLQ